MLDGDIAYDFPLWRSTTAIYARLPSGRQGLGLARELSIQPDTPLSSTKRLKSAPDELGLALKALRVLTYRSGGNSRWLMSITP